MEEKIYSQQQHTVTLGRELVFELAVRHTGTDTTAKVYAAIKLKQKTPSPQLIFENEISNNTISIYYTHSTGYAVEGTLKVMEMQHGDGSTRICVLGNLWFGQNCINHFEGMIAQFKLPFSPASISRLTTEDTTAHKRINCLLV
jgi:hypothetical protein